MKHQWNTGRQYSNIGQLIVAEVQDRHIRFSDISRCIDGTIPLGDYMSAHQLDGDPWTLRELVMMNYDRGNYSGARKTLTWDDTAPIAKYNP